MNKTIYVRDEDVSTWDRAKELAGEKLSPIISSALRRFVAEKEAEQKGFERIEYEYHDAETGGLPRRKAFYGRWVIPPDKAETVLSEFSGEVDRAVVAITAKGAVVACSWTEDKNTDSQSYKTFRTFSSFEAGAQDPHTGWAVISAFKKLGVPVEELDI
jgi:hypothetical protein